MAGFDIDVAQSALAVFFRGALGDGGKGQDGGGVAYAVLSEGGGGDVGAMVSREGEAQLVHAQVVAIDTGRGADHIADDEQYFQRIESAGGGGGAVAAGGEALGGPE